MFVPASGITLIFNEFLPSFSLQIFTQDQAQFLTSYTPPLILTNWNSSLFNSICFLVYLITLNKSKNLLRNAQ